MKKNYYFFRKSVFALALFGCTASAAIAQVVEYPAMEKPGTAAVTAATTGDSWSLSNNLLSAKFVKTNGKLYFGGSPELGLQSGSELFRIKLGTGTTVKASEMTLGTIKTVDLTGSATAVKGSERFAGKAIEATFTYNNLSFVWRAVLRNGSHYLRTELEMTAKAGTAMTSLTPMIYTVKNETGNTAPKVVGNTRGAIIASNKIFAGLETPMGKNTVSGTSAASDFSITSWKANSFTPMSTSSAPAGVLSLGSGFSASQISAAIGNVAIDKGGVLNFTYKYANGNNRLNMVGVDLMKDGKVVASDYHVGFTGNQLSNNVYKLTIPAAGKYILRYLVETKTESINSTGTITLSVPTTATTKATASEFSPTAWSTSDWKTLATTDYGTIPSSVLACNALAGAYTGDQIVTIQKGITVSDSASVSALFKYVSGNTRINLCGVDLLKGSEVVASDYHFGYTGNQASDNTYTFNVPAAGTYTMRYWAEKRTDPISNTGTITFTVSPISNNINVTLDTQAPVTVDPTTDIEGEWSRGTTLAAGNTWKVSAVVGLIADGQARRSVLAYSERERAVPWRAFPLYNSWYELNINRNNSQDYSGNMTVAQCTDVVNNWKTAFYDKYKTGISAFVWDDGWDTYGTWTFNTNFPNGFSEPNAAAKSMNSGIGCWLGPVGGYGTSGSYRRAYWSSKGGMQLSNAAYYNVFLTACLKMISDYDFRFFKFDGISAQFSSVGPDAGTTGEENAEGIIAAENKIRETKPDIFFNTTVGTWASPFWFHVSDAVWRQENDYGTTGVGTDREKWITYRDRLVYQNFIQNSPLCPINTLMTHGMILSTHGGASNRDYSGIVREMRCAFGCGSGMVELYLDYALMNSINSGKLWSDLADCIKWQKANADVLPDVHWVGGNPWDGTNANIYGWAAWNSAKSTLTLRNPATTAKTYTSTLREVFDIPSYIGGKIKLSDAFSQTAMKTLTDAAIDIDTQFTITIPASTVLVYNGVNTDTIVTPTAIIAADKTQQVSVSARGKFIEVSNAPANSVATVYTMVGSACQQAAITESPFTMSAPAAGIYMVKVADERGRTLKVQKVLCK